MDLAIDPVSLSTFWHQMSLWTLIDEFLAYNGDMHHIFWSIICKTKNCQARHFVSYIGEDISGEIITGEAVPIRFKCLDCEKEYDYLIPDIKLFPSSGPPPDNYHPLF